jgi:hypothetical protein
MFGYGFAMSDQTLAIAFGVAVALILGLAFYWGG